jgi:histidine phosphotransfer protein HptB
MYDGYGISTGAEKEMAEHINKALLFELREILGDEYAILIETFLTESSSFMSEILSAFEVSNSIRGATAVASLKGASMNLGAMNLVSLCQKILLECKASRFQQSDVLLHALQEELNYVTIFLRKEVA